MELALLMASGVVALLMAWAIGAQDVSNALGTSVGSKALTVRQAIVVGAVCEFLGSLVGGEVAGTISGGILEPALFAGSDGVDLYARLMFTTMAGAFAWLGTATYFALPVSTTHSMVGSLVGVGVMAKSWDAVQYRSLAMIVSSWVTSPLMGGTISYLLFSMLHAGVLSARNPAAAAAAALPFYVGGTAGTLCTFLALAGPKAYRLAPMSAMAAGAVTGAATTLLYRHRQSAKPAAGKRAAAALRDEEAAEKEDAAFTFVPVSELTVADPSPTGPGGDAKPKADADPQRTQRRKRPAIATSSSSVSLSLSAKGASGDGGSSSSSSSSDGGSGGGGGTLTHSHSFPSNPLSASVHSQGSAAGAGTVDSGKRGSDEDRRVYHAERAFLPLMVLTACVVSFAHGSNDVSNAIGPFTAIVEIYRTGNVSAQPAPIWVLVAGGVGIVAGLATYGYKVMATVGEKITKLTFTRGFAAQIGTAGTVLTATQLGVSVSTTHCLIGAISGVALVEGKDKLNVGTLKRIAVSWLVTIPASAFFSIVLYMTMELVDPVPDV